MNEDTRFSRIKALVGSTKITELYTLALITFGLPYCVYIFLGWKWAVVMFVVTQTAIGLVNARETK